MSTETMNTSNTSVFQTASNFLSGSGSGSDSCTSDIFPRLGYACINNTLNYPKARKDTTCRITSAYKAGEKTGFDPETPEYSAGVYSFLIRYGLKNTDEIIDILNWHVKVGLRFYRLSSALFPHIDNELLRTHMTEQDINDYRSLNPFKKNLEKIAEIAFNNGIRLTTHPDPYAVLASPDEEKVKTTILMLTWHGLLFNIMEKHIEQKYGKKDAFKDSILCLHVGGRYDKLGGKVGTLKRWAHNFRTMVPDFVQKHICVENCEKSYAAADLLPLCEELKIPLIFDFHHYDCYPLFHKDEETQESTQDLLPRIVNTWLVRGMRPKFHLSDQAPGKCTGAHDEFVQEIPEPLLILFKEKKIGFDIMIEAKAKDYAVFYLLAKYPFLNNTNIEDPYSLIHPQYPNVPIRPVPVAYSLIGRNGSTNNQSRKLSLPLVVMRKKSCVH
jgi:UV DNA damage endonuclease